jgi:hypothetical protein
MAEEGKGCAEEADARSGHGLAQHFGQQHQLIIMNPDEVVGFEVFEHHIAKAAVGIDVSLPVFGLEIEQRRKLMKERPERLVRVAFIEAVRDLFGDVHGEIAFALGPAPQRLFAPLIVGVGRIARPAHPDALRAFDDRPHRRREAPRAFVRAPPVARTFERER